MAFFMRDIAEVSSCSFFVAETPKRRQLTVVELVVDSENAQVNAVVLPVPTSELRGVEVVDMRGYCTLMQDAWSAFALEGETQERQGRGSTFYHPGSSRVLVARRLDDLERLAHNGAPLALPRRMMKMLRASFSSGCWSFVVCLWRQKHEQHRLTVAYSHPLMRGRLYVPAAVVQRRPTRPKRPAAGVDDQRVASWERRGYVVYSANTRAGVAREQMQREARAADAKARLQSGVVWAALPEPGVRRVDEFRQLVFTHEESGQTGWLPFSRLSRRLRRARALWHSNAAEARRELRAVMREAPTSSAIALYADFCSQVTGEPEKARELYLAAVALNPLNAEANHKLGRLRQALENDPYSPDILVDCAKELGDPELVKRALAIDPKHVGARALFNQVDEERMREHHELTEDAQQHLDVYLSILGDERKQLFA